MRQKSGLLFFRKSVIFFLIFVELGCESAPKLQSKSATVGPLFSHCENLIDNNRSKISVLDRLDLIQNLYDNACYSDVIYYGPLLRNYARDKNYHILAEAMEVFTPEGSLTPYTLESFERSYLSILIAVSYIKLGRPDDGKIELRKAYEEETAVIYNYEFEKDSLSAILQAALWESLGEFSTAEGHWRRALAQTFSSPETKSFIQARLERKTSAPLRIFRVGFFPQLDWHYDYRRERPYYNAIHSTGELSENCFSDGAAVLNTQGWITQIDTRGHPEYHPLIRFKSLTRLPFGILYGTVLGSAGVATAVGGCAAEFSVMQKQSSSSKYSMPLCQASVTLGGKIIREGVSLSHYILKPDMRHWRYLPEAFLLSNEEPNKPPSDCTNRLLQSRKSIRIL